jgi:MoxR-like ATPase
MDAVAETTDRAKEAPDTSSALKLEVTNSKGKTFVVQFKPGTYDVGRAEGCAIRFWEHAKGISPRHAQITVGRARIRIMDLESETGTMVNGNVIRERVLEDADLIAIGKVTMRVRIPRDRAAAATDSKAGLVIPPPDATPEVVEGERAAEQLAEELRLLQAATARLTGQIGKRIVGQREIIRMVWATILARGHCLLVGVPGLAKTYIVSTFAEVLGLQFKRIQFTPDLMPSDIIGSNVIHEGEDRRRYFEFVQGPVFTQLLLADEINRTPPKTQAALLEAMQERQVTVGSKSLSLPDPFCVIATQNPIEQEGTYPLPEAQLDRFMLCLNLDYPEDDDEVEILLETTRGIVPDVECAMGFEDILRFHRVVNRIAATRTAAAYAAALARRTRPTRPDAPAWLRRVVDWGAGPRAGQSLLRTAKALAAMEGRPAISCDDVREAAPSVLRHRISCNYRARADGMDENEVVRRALEEVPQP